LDLLSAHLKAHFRAIGRAFARLKGLRGASVSMIRSVSTSQARKSFM